jgi:hypothetical protein
MTEIEKMVMNIVKVADHFAFSLNRNSPSELVRRFFVRYDTPAPIAAIITGLSVTHVIGNPDAITW